MTDKLRTGIDVLDRKLDGGIPPGRLIAFSAPPDSQSELFLYEMAAVRHTTYLTTERTTTDIRDALAQTGTSPTGVDIKCITTNDSLGEALTAINNLSSRSTLIIDPMELLERQDNDAYRAFLNDVKKQTANTDSMTILHCLDGRRIPANRDKTKYIADIVFSLSTEIRGGTVHNSLAIPKSRSGQALPETIDLDLTADVTIDVTRKIA